MSDALLQLQRIIAADTSNPEEQAMLEGVVLRQLLQWSRTGGKRCSRCRQVLPLSAFGENTARQDGLQHACRACRQGA